MEKVQFRYEDIERIAHQFADMHQRVVECAVKLGQQFQVLENGGWIGRGFDQFEAEVKDEIAPALRRLSDVLNEVSNAVRQAGERMQQAEEEARGEFLAQDDASGGSAAPLGGGFGQVAGAPRFGGIGGFPDVARPMPSAPPPIDTGQQFPSVLRRPFSNQTGHDPFSFPVLPAT
ncbi:MAG: WXG100 family type VII secretion target [Chloroflexi bacterium]|nr:WXG100 family type VII secretion target [Chloroflexota bacterium]